MANHFRIWSLTLIVTLVTVVSATVHAADKPEQLLEKAIQEVAAQQQTQALNTLNQLIRDYPHFQLAQLMRADLLYAQGHVLNQMGGPALDTQQLNPLQAEAKARINAVKQISNDAYPDYLLSTIPHWLSYLLTIDLQASRAYLFDVQNGAPHFLNSFYISQGKLGAGKVKEGDKRSPIGIYQLTKPIQAQQLSSFYGAGALPLAYPNSWDKRNKRSGHGIWLHGTPLSQYSRPPLASDGCMVFSNDDLQQLLSKLDWQKTLVITDTPLHWREKGSQHPEQQALTERLMAWKAAWEKQDLPEYLAFYADDFIGSKDETKAQWAERKQQIFATNRPHRIQLDAPLILAYPNEPNIAITLFEQTYQRDGLMTNERKRLWWQKQHERWVIINEEILS